MFHVCGLVASLWLALAAAAGDVVVESPRLRLVIGEDAAWRTLADKATGRD